MAGGEVGGQPRDFIPGVKWGSGGDTNGRNNFFATTDPGSER